MKETVDQCPDLAEGVTLLSRRYIEAQIVSPIFDAMAGTLGRQRALELLTETTSAVARRQGRAFRDRAGSGDLAAFAHVIALWQQEDALTVEMLSQNKRRLEFNITRCRYAEMYAGCGIEAIGEALSCARDFAFVQGFNPDIQLTRTQTILMGAPFCDFRFTLK